MYHAALAFRNATRLHYIVVLALLMSLACAPSTHAETSAYQVQLRVLHLMPADTDGRGRVEFSAKYVSSSGGVTGSKLLSGDPSMTIGGTDASKDVNLKANRIGVEGGPEGSVYLSGDVSLTIAGYRWSAETGAFMPPEDTPAGGNVPLLPTGVTRLAAPSVTVRDGEPFSISIGSEPEFLVPEANGLYRVERLHTSVGISLEGAVNQQTGDTVHVSLKLQRCVVSEREPLPWLSLDVGRPLLATTTTSRAFDIVLNEWGLITQSSKRQGTLLLAVRVQRLPTDPGDTVATATPPEADPAPGTYERLQVALQAVLLWVPRDAATPVFERISTRDLADGTLAIEDLAELWDSAAPQNLRDRGREIAARCGVPIDQDAIFECRATFLAAPTPEVEVSGKTASSDSLYKIIVRNTAGGFGGSGFSGNSFGGGSGSNSFGGGTRPDAGPPSDPIGSAPNFCFAFAQQSPYLRELHTSLPYPLVLIWDMKTDPPFETGAEVDDGTVIALHARERDTPGLLDVMVGCHVRTMMDDGKRALRRGVPPKITDAGMTASLPMALGVPKGFSFVDEAAGRRFFLILELHALPRTDR